MTASSAVTALTKSHATTSSMTSSLPISARNYYHLRQPETVPGEKRFHPASGIGAHGYVLVTLSG